MKRTIQFLSFGFFTIGVLSLFLMPQLWAPEPILVFQVGAGASIFISLLLLALLLQLLLIGEGLERKRFQYRLEKASRIHDEKYLEFIRRLDHEIKNPLTGLHTAFTNFNEAREESERNQAKENFYKALDRLTHLLRDLRKMYELDSQMIERRPIDISQLVEDIVDATQALPAYERREINVMVSQIPWPLPFVIGDQDLLGLALYNLLDNALKFSHVKDPIEIRLREDGHSIFIEIADRGTGIPPSEQESIFEDLYRGSNAQNIDGSGIGLSLVRRIVNLHHGDISLRSINNHIHGSVFTLRLPTKKPAQSGLKVFTKP